MQTKYSFTAHISEDRLEEYAFSRVAESEAAQIEEHVLICEACQHSLADIDHFILLMKKGTSIPLSSKKAAPWVRYAIAGTLAAALVAGLALGVGSKASAVERVELAALRGPAIPTVHAGHSAEFRIESPDLEDAAYRIELVDASGRQLWSGKVFTHGHTMLVAEPKPLKAGQYWIRLYSSSDALLKEFSLIAV